VWLMLSAIFLVNRDGVILIEKQYRERIERSEIESALASIQDRTRIPPGVVSNGDYTILLHQERDIWVVGVCEGDEFALFGVSVLQYVGTLLSTLLADGCTELSIKNEYPVVYQILDYAVDFGFPFLDEGNTIHTLLTSPPTDYSKGIRLQLDLQRPWRSVGVRYSTNEIFVDVLETIDVTVSSHGRRDFCHIRGAVEVTSKLSGTPFCKLILPSQIHYEDVAFHRCIENEAAESKVLTFVPPDGRFTLMKYRITATQATLPLWITPKFQWSRNGVSFDIVAKRADGLPKPLENVEIRFEFPEGVLPPVLTPSDGKAIYDPTQREVVWVYNVFSRQEAITLKGNASTESGFELGGRFPIVSAKFTSPQYSASGFKVDRLEIERVEYKTYKGIKYLAQAGNYEFRSGLC
jgi:AP-3 complex subunit mu